ncbi:hypothetical protein VOLCADRAFT_121012 [Volvox carteri f. nagariensis]|uniref:ER membrane protein complex subunit 7 beta-sandwich domain-containing protein n=1 Tax=Volvox carteri f. nagariensis TaxID=3068 RepID=D8TZE9_VOLCA|nr:uncharacterized protein VOLCADRAFT_121012 [Volvox carteri f. nagariensis]EFJ47265.1 hypothetical protein VOLCADRAFT_121012 [Volvox carteri f. nagariensis]|eukprot:XP_002951814.1 hypothetical protein VOLCADRAFT_121012 [Volvox carteri f. nagariensis]
MELLTAVLLLTLLGLVCADPSGVIRGKIIIPSTMNHSSTVLTLHTAHGDLIRTFVGRDGSFVLSDVPSGVHLLQPFHLLLIFPEIRVEINRKGTLVRASLSHNRHLVLHSPLVIRPAGEAQYYEKRKPFDVWSFVKSPYGIMIVISVFAIVVFPRMKMDPEDYKELQEQMRGASNGQAEGGQVAGQRQQAARLRDR